VDGQTTPHAPQLPLSVCTSMQLPLHIALPVGHSLQIPWLQYGVDPPQATPHAPQLFGSQSTGVHAPSQNFVPSAQTYSHRPSMHAPYS
jgi:hypothetical protein